MSTEEELLLNEFTELDKLWTRREDELVHFIDSIISIVKRNNDITRVNQKLKEKGEEWKQLHLQISKFTKNLEKKYQFNLVDILDEGQFDEHCHNEAILKAIVQHLYREGDFVTAEALLQECPNLKCEGLKEQFEEMHLLNTAVKEGNFDFVITWIDSHEKKLSGEGIDKVLFKLHALTFLSILQDANLDKSATLKAVRYSKTHLAPFLKKFPDSVETLMGYLAYASQLDKERFANLTGLEDLRKDVADLVTSMYCGILGLPRRSPLEICFRAGLISWPKISQVLSLMKNQPGVEWNPKEELPVEVDLGAEMRFHSIFVCPVLKQQTTDDNPPMMMPCGHVICKEALNKLCKGHVNQRFKCPYCPSESTSALAQRLYL